MNDSNVSSASYLDPAPAPDGPAPAVELVAPTPLEFVGASNVNIAEAVRRALSHASLSLRTLDGVGVVVIPQIDGHGRGPRFQVRLRVSQPSADARS